MLRGISLCRSIYQTSSVNDCAHEPHNVRSRYREVWERFRDSPESTPGETWTLQKCRKCGWQRVRIVTDGDPHYEYKPWKPPDD